MIVTVPPPFEINTLTKEIRKNDTTWNEAWNKMLRESSIDQLNERASTIGKAARKREEKETEARDRVLRKNATVVEIELAEDFEIARLETLAVPSPHRRSFYKDNDEYFTWITTLFARLTSITTLYSNLCLEFITDTVKR